MKGISRRTSLTLAGTGGAAIAFGHPFLTSIAEAASAPDAQMKAVLDELAAFDAPSIKRQTPFNARNNPTIADAVMGVSKRGRPTVEAVGEQPPDCGLDLQGERYDRNAERFVVVRSRLY